MYLRVSALGLGIATKFPRNGSSSSAISDIDIGKVNFLRLDQGSREATNYHCDAQRTTGAQRFHIGLMMHSKNSFAISIVIGTALMVSACASSTNEAPSPAEYNNFGNQAPLSNAQSLQSSSR